MFPEGFARVYVISLAVMYTKYLYYACTIKYLVAGRTNKFNIIINKIYCMICKRDKMFSEIHNYAGIFYAITCYFIADYNMHL